MSIEPSFPTWPQFYAKDGFVYSYTPERGVGSLLYHDVSLLGFQGTLPYEMDDCAEKKTHSLGIKTILTPPSISTDPSTFAAPFQNESKISLFHFYPKATPIALRHPYKGAFFPKSTDESPCPEGWATGKIKGWDEENELLTAVSDTFPKDPFQISPKDLFPLPSTGNAKRYVLIKGKNFPTEEGAKGNYFISELLSSKASKGYIVMKYTLRLIDYGAERSFSFNQTLPSERPITEYILPIPGNRLALLERITGESKPLPHDFPKDWDLPEKLLGYQIHLDI